MKKTIWNNGQIRQLQGVQDEKNPYLLAQSLEIVYFCTQSTENRVMTKPSTHNRVKR